MKSAFLVLFAMAALCIVGSATMLGAYRELDCDGEEPQIMLGKAVEHVQRTSNAADPITIHRCNKMEVQVVAGFNYRMDIDVKRGEKIENHEIIIYRNVKGVHSVTKHSVDGKKII